MRRNTLKPPSGQFSRRAFFTTTFLGALGGATWGTGFARLIRGNHPRFSILGDEDWQVVLVTSGRIRVVICIGDFQASPTPVIDALTGTLRPRIDVILMSRTAATTLGSAPLRSRMVSKSYVLENLHTNAVTAGMHMTFPEFTLGIHSVPSGFNASSGTASSTWLILMRVGTLLATFGPDLETILALAPDETSIAIAPSGDPYAFHRRWQGPTIVINRQHALETTSGNRESTAVDRGMDSPYLVRTFPSDISRFGAIDDRLSLPRWAETW